MPEMESVEITREELRAGEVEILNLEEQLWRQVHPDNVTRQESKDIVGSEAFLDVVGPGAFRGSPAAREEVSTSMASVVTAVEAYEHYTGVLALKSAGSYSVTVETVVSAYARVVDDSALQIGDISVKGHAFIDLRGMEKALQRRARSVMADHATKAGRVHPQ